MRRCESCTRVIAGRADRRFCDARCRAIAHRARRVDWRVVAAQLAALDAESRLLDEIDDVLALAGRRQLARLRYSPSSSSSSLSSVDELEDEYS